MQVIRKSPYANEEYRQLPVGAPDTLTDTLQMPTMPELPKIEMPEMPELPKFGKPAHQMSKILGRIIKNFLEHLFTSRVHRT